MALATRPIAAPRGYTTSSSRWAALTVRDPAAANAFLYGVLSTKIYCRPTCPARLARRANVTFYDSPEQAVAAGYRACKRCKPSVPKPPADPRHGTHDSQTSPLEFPPDPEAEDVRSKIHRAVVLVREAAGRGEVMSLATLSKDVGLSKWHLHRVFKRLQGVTPREMAEQTMAETSLRNSGYGDAAADGNSEGRSEGQSPASGASMETESLPPSCDLDVWSMMLPDDGVNWADLAGVEEPLVMRVDTELGTPADVEWLLDDLFPELRSKEGPLYPRW